LPDLPDWRAPFPHGNKMVAATDLRDTSRAVFLDTDMVCLRPLLAMADCRELRRRRARGCAHMGRRR
jgi:hypothetical protein